jgi:molybdopterin-guanine dinucleotide biosynthesis protein A
LKDMSSRIKSVAGYVLAGGKSRRMGRPKALLVLDGETMIERQLRALRSVARSVQVVGWPGHVPWPEKLNARPGVRRLPDKLPDAGPLGGIYTALLHSRSEFNLFLGCDMPFVEPGLLEFICRRALESRADITVPKSPRRLLEPLCAVYRRRALRAIQASLEAREYKITRFSPRVKCEVIPWREIAAAGLSPQVFENLNVAEDYAKAKRFLATSHE